MDDDRIRQLTEEVLAAVGSAPAGSSVADLESRVAALETAVAGIQPAAPTSPPAVVHVHAHPALQVLTNVPSGGDRCVLEPDKPCVQSGACRSLGH
jgi:hypothetical protein